MWRCDMWPQRSLYQAATVILLLSAGLLAPGLGLAQQPATEQQAEPQKPSVPMLEDVQPEAAPLKPSQLTEERDREVEQALEAAFGRVATLEAVEVSVGSGVVHLDGRVDRPRARDAAEAIARRLEGVLHVDNRIALAEDAVVPSREPAVRTVQDEAIQERLTTIFSHVSELENVRVSVESGVVRLEGEVPTLDATGRAGELAEGLDGVLYVDNDLEETRDFSRRLEPALEQFTSLVESAVIYVPLAVVAVVVLLLFWLVARAISRVDFLFRRLSDRPLLQNLVRQFVSTVIFLGGVIVVLEVFNVTALVGAVLGTAGVAGIALGFAFRDIGENYLASVVLSLRRPFNHNDHVRIEDFEGKVVRLTTRDTVLMTLDGNHVRVPNGLVFKSVIHNYTRNPRRRFSIPVGVSVEEDLGEVRRIGAEALAEIPAVLDQPAPFARIIRLGESTVDMTFFGWIDQRDYDFLSVESEATRLLKAALDAAGIEMPEPIYRVNLSGPGRATAPQPRPVEPVEPVEPVQPAEPADLETEADIDAQIAEDRRDSDEPDLLED